VLSLILLAVGLSACGGSSPPAPATAATPTASVTAAAIFLTPNGGDLPIGGGALPITVVTAASASGNVPAGHVVVTLTATGGTLSDEQVQTDSTGHALVTWTGTSTATITARAGDTTGSAQIRVLVPFVPPPPAPIPSPLPDTPVLGSLQVDIIASPRYPDAITPVTFTPRVFGSAPSPEGLTYAWNFADGATSTAVSPTHLFAAADHWAVTLTVSSNDGRRGFAMIFIVPGSGPK
jgi:hypothetical protein